MTMSRAAVFPLAAAVLAASVAARAEPPRSPSSAVSPTPLADVEAAEQLYAKLDYEQASAVAERALEGRALSHAELVRVYRVLAVTYATLGREDAATDAFYRLLVCDPDATVDPNLGPKVTGPFVQARGAIRALPARPGLEIGGAIDATGGTLRATTRDPSQATRRVAVSFRWVPNGAYATVSAPWGERVPVRVGSAPPGASRLEFFAQALDDRGHVLMEAGTADAPRTALLTTPRAAGASDPKARPLYARPAFLVIVSSLAAASAGAALYFALRPDGPPTRATLTPVLGCGSERCP